MKKKAAKTGAARRRKSGLKDLASRKRTAKGRSLSDRDLDAVTGGSVGAQGSAERRASIVQTYPATEYDIVRKR